MAIDDMTNLASWERGRSPVLSFVDLNPMDQFFLGTATRSIAGSPCSLSTWWLTYPSEKYESQLGILFPIYGKINVPNHYFLGICKGIYEH